MNDIFDAKIKSKQLINKSDIYGFINNTDLDGDTTKISSKIRIKSRARSIEKLQTFDSSFFIGHSYFINDQSQNFLIFQLIFDTFAMQASHTE